MHRTPRPQNNTPGRSVRETHMRPVKPPERPLVPYMKFSRKMWSQVRAQNPDVQLLEIGKIVGQMWREAPDTEKMVFQQEYELDKVEYDRQLKGYHQAMASQHAVASRNRTQNLNNTSSSAAIQPVDDEDPFEMSRKRLAAIRYDRDNRLMTELFSSACLPDSRSLVPQTRIDQLKRQATSLTAHQNKLNEELDRLTENFLKRKRTLEDNSAKFNEDLNKNKEERPNFTEDKYREYVELWTNYYLDEFQKQKQNQGEGQTEEKNEKEDQVEDPAPVSKNVTEETTDATQDGEKTEQSVDSEAMEVSQDSEEPSEDSQSQESQ